MNVTVVIPVCDEVENLRILYGELTTALLDLPGVHEFILVDDGSTDGSQHLLSELAQQDQRVRVIVFRRNYGQTAALQAGIEHASGDVIVMLDADLQNDPADIPALLEALDGHDLVQGWRRDRQDALVHRRVPSLIANAIVSRVTGVPVHDLGCTLRAIRSDLARELELYGDMHRFIPVLAHARGARCTEVVTNHRPRRFGETKYGIGRVTRVLLDLVTVKFMLSCFDRPMRLFGRLGLGGLAVAGLSGCATVGMKLISGVDMTGNPLLMLTVLCLLLGAQFFGLGLLGEVCARIFYSGQRHHYAIRELHNLEADTVQFPRAA